MYRPRRGLGRRYQEDEGAAVQGIIGLRIDLHHHKAQHDVDLQARLLERYAQRITPFGWGLQIYHPHPEYYDRLAPLIRSIAQSTSIVIDHFAGLRTPSLVHYVTAKDPSVEKIGSFETLAQPGLSAITSLLRDGAIWVKLSAPYRCSEDTHDVYPAEADGHSESGSERYYDDMQPLVRALVEANPQRVLYGSDWPHTQPFHRRPKGLKGTDVEEFVDFDDAAWLRKLKSWLSAGEWKALMVENPRVFVGARSED